MPEFRYDPLWARWVIFAEERADRPQDAAEEAGSPSARDCPFCEGNEGHTPSEVWCIRRSGTGKDTPGWKVRVIPNKYPAVKVQAEPLGEDPLLFRRLQGRGKHEVVIETPRHDLDLAQMAVIQVERVLTAYRERLTSLYKDPRLVYVNIFKNKGREAGASLLHAHSQIIATPLVPHYVQEKLQASAGYYSSRGACLLCELMERERTAHVRVIKESKGFFAFAPFASRFPFEVNIAPKVHSSDFSSISRSGLKELAALLKSTLGWIRTALFFDVPYNLNLSTSPNPRVAPPMTQEAPLADWYHWHLEITPRLSRIAGFETGSGFHINHIPPEEAARILREIGSQDLPGSPAR